MSRRRQLLLALGILLLLILLVPPLAFYWRARHALPQYDGEARAPGLQQPVRILRDERAVPHLFAKSTDDLLFAQGYVHAQERLWQMDLSRRAARGQLAEVLGPGALELDKENRILGLGGVADRAAAQLDPEARRELEAYARGVNAFLDSGAALPPEFRLLRFEPARWSPADSLVWLEVMGWWMSSSVG